MTRRFLNLHCLYTLAAANPNRDDAGSPKSLTYGGVIRSRISSQAMTRPKRLGFEADTDGETTKRSTMTAEHIVNLATAFLRDSGVEVTTAQSTTLRTGATKAVAALTNKGGKEDASKPKAKNATPDGAEATGDAAGAAATDGPKDTLVWLAEKEMVEAATKLARRVLDATGADLRAEDLVTGGRTDSLAIAGFGRMFAARPDLQVEAAVQRSHAFTTHETVSEVDYFTTVDDLRVDHHGAGHLGINELTGGVYYWHANVDVDQLLDTWSAAGAADARDRLVAFFEALFLELPTGRQNTSAHHTLPSLVMAASAARPVSLQSAFEKPVRPQAGSGYLAGSVQALFAEHQRNVALLPSKFGPAQYAGTVEVDHQTAGQAASAADSLEDLAGWCADQVLAGAR